MKIQVSYQGVTVGVEGDDVTLDMFSVLYDKLDAKLSHLQVITHLDGNALKVAVQRDGYKEYVSGLKRGSPEVIYDSPTVEKIVEQQHETMAEKGVVNSPDKSPFALPEKPITVKLKTLKVV